MPRHILLANTGLQEERPDVSAVRDPGFRRVSLPGLAETQCRAKASTISTRMSSRIAASISSERLLLASS